MLKIAQIAQQRYACKKFDPERRLSPETLASLLSLLRFSPSSVNCQPWHFVLAQSLAGKAPFIDAAQGIYQANLNKIADCSLAVLFCVKTTLEDAYVQQLLDQEAVDGRLADSAAREAALKVRQFYIGQHQQNQDLACWMEKQVYLNLGAFLLGVAAMGLDAVPIEGVDVASLDQRLKLPQQGYRALAMVAVGYAATDDFNAQLPKSRWPQERLFQFLDPDEMKDLSAQEI
ncbi:MAG: oxygen-insensitive NAD(P)H nitroreductase [Thiotrichales bacterium]|nr:oxygen-insensitive NAD(P)H nitroreductase [Thiotrichales bacterium]